MSDPEKPKQKSYEIGGRRFYQTELSWQQEKWLADHVFTGKALGAMEHHEVMDLVRSRGPLMLAILLIEDGQTRVQKAQAGWAGVEQLAAFLAGECTAINVALYVLDFFDLNPAGNLWLLAQTPEPMPAPTPTGLTSRLPS